MGSNTAAAVTSIQSLLSAAQRRFKSADYQAAERLAHEALLESDARDERVPGAEARIWLGAALAQQGQYAPALRVLHEALGLIETHALPLHTGRACNYIAVCHEESGDFQTAVEWYERGLEQAREAGDRDVEVYLLANLADGWVNAGSAQKAMPLLDEAVNVARSVGDLANEAWCLSARARLRESLGDNEAARADHTTAVKVSQSSQSQRIVAETLRGEGAFLARNGDATAGIALLTRSLDIATKLGIHGEMFRAHEVLALVYERLGKWQEALEHFKRFHAIQAEMYRGVVRTKLENLNAVFELQRAKTQEEVSRLRNDELANTLRHVERQAREMERLSLQDPLTGVCNRRYLEAALSNGFVRSLQASQHPSLQLQPSLCVAMLDVDRFKQVNDRYTHAIGDDVLCRLARVVEQRLRVGDILARYGGEEFVLVLPQIGMPQMIERCEAIRHAIAADDWSRIAPGLQVTISLGVASADEVGDWEGLLALADRRMYSAKNSGRNRVCGPDGIATPGRNG